MGQVEAGLPWEQQVLVVEVAVWWELEQLQLVVGVEGAEEVVPLLQEWELVQQQQLV